MLFTRKKKKKKLAGSFPFLGECNLGSKVVVVVYAVMQDEKEIEKGAFKGCFRNPFNGCSPVNKVSQCVINVSLEKERSKS